MSAFLVNKVTIDAVVSIWIAFQRELSGEPIEAFLDQSPADVGVGTRLGHLLWLENHESVSYRYPDNPKLRESRPIYRFEPCPIPDLDMACSRALGAVQCLQHQSCEHPGYKSKRGLFGVDGGGSVKAWLDALVVDICARMDVSPVAEEGTWVAWEVTERDELSRIAQIRTMCAREFSKQAGSEHWSNPTAADGSISPSDEFFVLSALQHETNDQALWRLFDDERDIQRQRGTYTTDEAVILTLIHG